ncbi:hypothetical protein [Methanobacterium sp. MBAC-LM]
MNDDGKSEDQKEMEMRTAVQIIIACITIFIIVVIIGYLLRAGAIYK